MLLMAEAMGSSGCILSWNEYAEYHYLLPVTMNKIMTTYDSKATIEVARERLLWYIFPSASASTTK